MAFSNQRNGAAGTSHSLDWVRGPLLLASILIFATEVFWRLFSLWRMPTSKRPGAPARSAFSQGDALVTINPYVFHIGRALVFFGYAPHIAFIRRITALHWPALPDMVMYLAAAATVVSLLMALMFRLTDSVLKKISRADEVDPIIRLCFTASSRRFTTCQRWRNPSH